MSLAVVHRLHDCKRNRLHSHLQQGGSSVIRSCSLCVSCASSCLTQPAMCRSTWAKGSHHRHPLFFCLCIAFVLFRSFFDSLRPPSPYFFLSSFFLLFLLLPGFATMGGQSPCTSFESPNLPTLFFLFMDEFPLAMKPGCRQSTPLLIPLP